MACLQHLLRISSAEQRVLMQLLQGLPNRGIATALGLSPRTVESHISAMLEKSGCHNRTQLLLWAQGVPRASSGWIAEAKQQHNKHGSMD